MVHSRFAILLVLPFLFSTTPNLYSQTQRTCPTTNGAPNPPNPSLGLAENHSGRRNIDGDYLVIEYDAVAHQSVWYDYHHTWDPNARDEQPYDIARNGSFLPVVYTREKIAVHVCNLHFADQLTVTTSPLAVPEGGADIRGYTTTTALTSLTSTLDALQSSTVTGGAAPESGLGFGATAPVGATVVSGVAPGSLVFDETKGEPTYTDATITASGEQIALMMYSIRKNADALADSVGEMEGHTQPNLRNALPGSIDSLNQELARVRNKLPKSVGKNSPAASDAAAFDEDMAEAQALSVELGSLSTSLSVQAFGARAVTLQNNYTTLRGILDLVKEGRDQRNCQPQPPAPGAPLPPPVKVPPFTPAQIGQLSADQVAAFSIPELASLTTPQVQAITAAQLIKLSSVKLDALMQPRPLDTPPGADQPPCGAFEKEKFEEFAASYKNELQRLGELDVDKFAADVASSREKVFGGLEDLKQDLDSIDTDTGAIFSQMNDWYQNSAVEQTDLVTPSNSNTLMRLSIIVQRGYTPFTLTNNPSAATPASPATTTAAVASTSTPAHAVKTILVEVHRIANFNLAGGVMMIHVPTSNFTLTPAINSTVTGTTTTTTGGTTTSTGTTTTTTTTNNYGGSCAGGPTTPTPANAATYSCIITAQKTNWQVAGMVGISWYPWGRDYFPRRKGFTNYPRNYFPAFLIGTSVTSFGSAFGGLNLEPISGIDFYGGVASANRSVLPNGIASTTLVPTTYTVTPGTQVHVGIAAGIAFDPGVIGQLFSKSTPTGGVP